MGKQREGQNTGLQTFLLSFSIKKFRKSLYSFTILSLYLYLIISEIVSKDVASDILKTVSVKHMFC